MTNQTVTCMLADGCVKIVKVADRREYGHTILHRTNQIRAASIDTAIHEILIGNIKYIAGREKENESPPQCSSSYTGPIIFENSNTGQSLSRDIEAVVCEDMCAKVSVHTTKLHDNDKSLVDAGC